MITNRFLMKIIEVTTNHDCENFLRFPENIYRTDPNWCQPLERDIKSVFDPQKNKFFKHGECVRFLAVNNKKEVTGRIAAFINKRTSAMEDQPTGGIGFFDCIQDKATAFALFDACKEWLAARGMEAMDGPVNFGERDSWWGLLTEGFTPVPYKMNYNPDYYRFFFEEFGFKNYFEQWCFSLKVADRPQEKFYIRHAEVAANPDYTARCLRKAQLAAYAEDFRHIYNLAWARHGGGKELEKNQVLSFFKKMKPVMDEKIIWFAYYKGEPVAMWVNIPDINKIFRKFKGRFGLLEKFRFAMNFRKRVVRKMIGIVFGVVPQHQGKGVDAYLIIEGAKVIQSENLYDDLEMQWVGDFNPRMVAICKDLGAYRSRTLITYRYLFDRHKEFKRHRVL